MFTVTRVSADLTMCTDCAVIIANGDDSSMSEEQAQVHATAMFEQTKDWPGQIVVDDQTDDFSNRRCDTCDTTLAGQRWSGSLLEQVQTTPLVYCAHPVHYTADHIYVPGECVAPERSTINRPVPQWVSQMAGATTTSRFD